MTRLSPLAILFVSVGLAACGGGDDDGDAPSKQEFAKSAEQICRDTAKEIEKIGGSAETPEDVAKTIDKVIKKSQDAADQLVDLDRPDGADGETAKRFTEGFRQELNEKLVPALQDLKSALEKKDPAAAQKAAAELQKLEATDSDKAARELGANACVGST
jgi:hypothetical protein